MFKSGFISELLSWVNDKTISVNLLSSLSQCHVSRVLKAVECFVLTVKKYLEKKIPLLLIIIFIFIIIVVAAVAAVVVAAAAVSVIVVKEM